jgi:hypothetical protein
VKLANTAALSSWMSRIRALSNVTAGLIRTGGAQAQGTKGPA